MGNPTFYYFPTPDGSALHTIDLGEPLAELFSEFEVDSNTAVGLDGSMYRTTGVHREIVTIQRDRFKLGEDLAIELQALQSHLDRGHSCSFAVDSDKAYCFPLTLNASGGDHQVNVSGDPFKGFTGGAVPDEHDYITIESQNPQLLFEQHKVKALSSSTPAATISSSAGGQINLSPPIAFKHNISFARYYRFWPLLKRPQADVGKSIVTNESGRLFTLNLRLVVDYQKLFSHHPNVGTYLTQDPEWQTAVGAYSAVEVFPEDRDFRINLDNSNPQSRVSDSEYVSNQSLIHPFARK